MWNLAKLATIFAVPGTPSAPVQFLVLNFATGTGVTGWIMTASLGIMVWFAVEKRRRQPNGGFEKFWYSHHLFIVFFACWQLHGMFCMIQPDRGALCSFNVIGVFWVSGCPLTRCPPACYVAVQTYLAFHSVSGWLVELCSSLSVSSVKSVQGTSPMSPKSFSTRPRSWKFKSRRKRPRRVPASTSSYPALRFPTGSGTHSRSPRLLRRTTSRSTSASLVTLPPPWQKPLAATLMPKTKKVASRSLVLPTHPSTECCPVSWLTVRLAVPQRTS